MNYQPVNDWHGTTILSVRKNNTVVVAGDGQVSLGSTVIKGNAKKVRRIGQKKDIIAGFAGSTADAFTLLERLESKLDRYSGQMMRSCVELAKDWRTDRYLRKLEAMMIVVNKDISLVLTGQGDVLEPEENGIIGIGSGGNYALSAAQALVKFSNLSVENLAIESMKIASKICVYTNENLTIEKIESKEQ